MPSRISSKRKRVGSPMKKIALYGSFTPNMISKLRENCPQGFQTYQVPAGSDLSQLAQADYMVNRGSVVDESVMAAAPALRLIQKWGVGYDKIDVKAAGVRGIPVAICVGGNSIPVAEVAVTLMLSVLRNVVPMAERMKQGQWAREQFSPRSYLLHGKTVGLIGIGNIAKKVAAIVRGGFDCTVLYYDIFRLTEAEEQDLGVTYVDLDTLMSQSDIVSVHVPLLDSTAGMIDREKLERMKPTACIINTSRGGVIQEDDLIQVLQEGRILGAGLDTFAHEPLPQESPLLQMDCVVTTPHCGGNTIDNDGNMAAICMQNIVQYDTSGDDCMRSIVNRSLLA